MKKLLMFCILGIIYAGNAFGDVLFDCNLKFNCGDGEGTMSPIQITQIGNPIIEHFPDNTGCSKIGNKFSHWSVSGPNGEGVLDSIAIPGEPYSMVGICERGELILTAVYVSNGTITSKPYVDREISTKQITIPITGTNSGTMGESVVTYTSDGNGVIGERGIYSDSSRYNASTDADKLITASALNTAFTTLPTTDTSKLVCVDNPDCTLWTIVDQLAYACKAYGEEATSASECCSGRFGIAGLDLNTGIEVGSCGCSTNNDCDPNTSCINGVCVGVDTPIIGPVIGPSPRY